MASLEASNGSGTPIQRPSMTALLSGGASRRRQSQQENGGRSTRLDRMMATLEWRHSHLTSDEYPMEINGIKLDFKQLMQGELTGLGTGATVWPAAHVLSKYLEKRWTMSNGGMKGLRVIDLGSGTGAVGLVARVLGAEVVLTDQEQLSFLMHENAVRTIKAIENNDEQGSQATTQPPTSAEEEEKETTARIDNNDHPGVVVSTYDWGLKDDHLSPPFDVIIVSDCVLPKLYPIEPLVDALVQLSKPRDHAKSVEPIILLSYEHRIHEHFDPRVRFEELATSAGFVKFKIPQSEHADLYQADDIELWELRVKSQVKENEYEKRMQTTDSVEIIKSADNSTDNNQCHIRCGSYHFNLNRVSNGGIGADLWASSIAMSQYLLEKYGNKDQSNDKNLKGKRILELGSGIGLVALTCFHLGATVVGTDMADVLPLLQENIASNPVDQNNSAQNLDPSPSIEVLAFNWVQPLPEALVGQSFDIVICADCVYAQTSIKPLLSALEKVTENNGGNTEILFANEQRSALEEFINSASKQNFDISQISISEVPGIANDTRPVVMYRGSRRSNTSK